MGLEKLEHMLELSYRKEGDRILIIYNGKRPHKFSVYGEFQKFYRKPGKEDLIVELNNYHHFDSCINPEEINNLLNKKVLDEGPLEVTISNFKEENTEIITNI